METAKKKKPAVKVNSNSVFSVSTDVVARTIDEEMIIVPIAAGIADADDELFMLNETGREIWNRLDGKKTVQEIIVELKKTFSDPEVQLETDVLGWIDQLVQRRFLVEKKN